MRQVALEQIEAYIEDNEAYMDELRSLYHFHELAFVKRLQAILIAFRDNLRQQLGKSE